MDRIGSPPIPLHGHSWTPSDPIIIRFCDTSREMLDWDIFVHVYIMPNWRSLWVASHTLSTSSAPFGLSPSHRAAALGLSHIRCLANFFCGARAVGWLRAARRRRNGRSTLCISSGERWQQQPSATG